MPARLARWLLIAVGPFVRHETNSCRDPRGLSDACLLSTPLPIRIVPFTNKLVQYRRFEKCDPTLLPGLLPVLCVGALLKCAVTVHVRRSILSSRGARLNLDGV